MVNKEEINQTESFADLFAKQIEKDDKIEGQVVKGTIISIEKEMINIDVGYKAEGRINIREFIGKNKRATPVVGDIVEVYLERVENKNGEAVLSREKARREESWETLEKASEIKKKVTGTIFGRVKGGFSVDLDGAIAFLPGSQVDVRPTRDSHHLVGSSQLFHILKMDRRRGNIVVSRRSVLEESRAEAKAELVSTMEEGQILEGIIKNITDYGAFVELESGIEGLVHVSEMSWTKKNMQPAKIVSTSEEVEVIVIEIDSAKRRISLGMKQCKPNPWLDLQKNYKIGSELEGEVKSITEFGLFVGLPGEMDGLIHLSDVDWNSKSEDIISKYKKGDLVKAKLLEIDIEKERVSLGIKQLSEDPMANNKDLIKGNIVTSIIKNITEKGLHVKINEGISGFVKQLELAKERTDQRVDRFAVGEKIDARIMSINSSTREVALSIKALQVAEEKQALKDYGSVDSGASLGDILGAALEKKAKKKVVIEKSKAKKATKTKAKIKAKTKTTTSKTKKAEPKK